MIVSLSHLGKRHLYVLLSLILAISLAILTLWPVSGWGIIVVLLLHYGAVVIALDRDLRQEEWLVFPLYLLLLAGTAYTFFSLYAEQNPWLLWSGVALYSLVIYGTLLTLNILNLSRAKPLPLARPALTVMTLLGFCSAFGMLYLTLVNQPSIWGWIVSAAAIGWLIAWPLIWLAIPVKSKAQTSLLWACLVAVITAQVALLTGLWPVTFVTALAIATTIYLSVGIIHQMLRHQLTRGGQYQYLALGLILIVTLFIFGK